MRKVVAGLAAVLVIAGAALAQQPSSQEPTGQEAVPPAPHEPSLPEPSHQDSLQKTRQLRLSQADLNALTDARIGMAKAMLQLTPEQAKLWPPVEEAIRNSAEAKYRRIAERRADGAEQHEPDPVTTMRRRGEALSERGAQLGKLAEALRPLYQTLTPEQKDRLRLVASHVLYDMDGHMGHRTGRRAGEGDED